MRATKWTAVASIAILTALYVGSRKKAGPPDAGRDTPGVQTSDRAPRNLDADNASGDRTTEACRTGTTRPLLDRVDALRSRLSQINFTYADRDQRLLEILALLTIELDRGDEMLQKTVIEHLHSDPDAHLRALMGLVCGLVKNNALKSALSAAIRVETDEQAVELLSCGAWLLPFTDPEMQDLERTRAESTRSFREMTIQEALFMNLYATRPDPMPGDTRESVSAGGFRIYDLPHLAPSRRHHVDDDGLKSALLDRFESPVMKQASAKTSLVGYLPTDDSDVVISLQRVAANTHDALRACAIKAWPTTARIDLFDFMRERAQYDPDASVRALAVTVLGTYASMPEYPDHLQSMFSLQDDPVVAESLIEQASVYMQSAFCDDPALFYRKVIGALDRCSDEQVRASLLSHVGQSMLVRARAKRAVPDWTADFAAIYKKEPAAIGRRAILTLLEWEGSAQGLAALERIESDEPDPAWRFSIAESIQRIKALQEKSRASVKSPR